MQVGSCITGRPRLLQVQGHGESGSPSVTELKRELSPGCPSRDTVREAQVTGLWALSCSDTLRVLWPMLE